jgi:pSer/pThr/pTyr-binding forkhead associated (FHA) protein
VLSDPTVSRNHARLNMGPDGWILTDLGSTNGTRINGWIVTSPRVVQPGDQVSFGLQRVVITR